MVNGRLIRRLTVALIAASICGLSASSAHALAVISPFGAPTYTTSPFANGGTYADGGMAPNRRSNGFSVDGSGSITANSNVDGLSTVTFGYTVEQSIGQFPNPGLPAGDYFLGTGLDALFTTNLPFSSATVGSSFVESTLFYGGESPLTVHLSFGNDANNLLKFGPHYVGGLTSAPFSVHLNGGPYTLEQTTFIEFDNVALGEIITVDLPNGSGISSVPEPASLVVWGFLGTGFVAASIWRRRRGMVGSGR